MDMTPEETRSAILSNNERALLPEDDRPQG